MSVKLYVSVHISNLLFYYLLSVVLFCLLLIDKESLLCGLILILVKCVTNKLLVAFNHVYYYLCLLLNVDVINFFKDFI